MKKSQQIIILKAKVIKLKAKLKEARMELAKWDSIKPIESTAQLFTTERVNESIKDLENEIIEKIIKENTKDNSGCFIQNDYDLITSTTLKTPNEWLKLMSEEEVKLWEENRSKVDKNHWILNMEEEMTFSYFISISFGWEDTPQREYYWQNLSNRYNN